MASSSKFGEKIAQLESHIKETVKKEKCTPVMLIAGIALPFLLSAIFFFIQPSFIQKKEGDKYVRDNKKMFYWVIGMTLLAWFGMYLFTYCKGYDKTAMFCSR